MKAKLKSNIKLNQLIEKGALKSVTKSQAEEFKKNGGDVYYSHIGTGWNEIRTYAIPVNQ